MSSRFLICLPKTLLFLVSQRSACNRCIDNKALKIRFACLIDNFSEVPTLKISLSCENKNKNKKGVPKKSKRADEAKEIRDQKTSKTHISQETFSYSVRYILIMLYKGSTGI